MERYVTDRMTGSDGAELFRHHWRVDDARAAVILVHGMAEHAARYDGFAARLQAAGFAVLAVDLRGHGQTALLSGERGSFGSGGWVQVQEDILDLARYARAQYPGVPTVLFGHSMGSVFARAAAMTAPELFRALILMGVTVDMPGRRNVAPLLAGVIAAVTGERPCRLIDRLTFGDFNRAFAPARTEFDWLSADRAEVDAYVADPMCGFVSNASLYQNVASMLLFTLKRKNIARIPRNMPMLILAGAMDPVAMNGKAVAFLEETWSAAGIPVRGVLIPGGRHEILNDSCREQVTDEILRFLEDALARREA